MKHTAEKVNKKSAKKTKESAKEKKQAQPSTKSDDVTVPRFPRRFPPCRDPRNEGHNMLQAGGGSGGTQEIPPDKKRSAKHYKGARTGDPVNEHEQQRSAKTQ